MENKAQEWHDPIIIMEDEDKWWGLGHDFDGMSIEDIKSASTMVPVNIVKNDADTGDTKNFYVKFGTYVQNEISAITVDDITVSFEEEKVKDEKNIEFVVEFVDPGEMEWDEYKRLHEKCLVLCIEDGNSFVIKDEIGADVTSDFKLLKSFDISGKKYNAYVKYSENEEFVPDTEKKISYEIVNDN